MNHDGYVYFLAYSPDNRYVLSYEVNSDQAHIWEAAAGREIARVPHYGNLSSVAFSNDGQVVVTASADNSVSVWEYLPEDLIADACLRVTRNLTKAEWEYYIGDTASYQAVCPNLPLESDQAAQQ